MPGLGHVEPGGPELTEKLSSEITLSKISVGGMDNNAYLLDTGSGVSADRRRRRRRADPGPGR